jgi:hypothetical protein
VGSARTGWAWAAAESTSRLRVAVDSEAAVLVAGSFSGAPPVPDLAGKTAAEGRDAFVAKLGCDGEPIWSRALGGPDGAPMFPRPQVDSDEATALAVDDAGSVFVAGTFCSSAAFDPASPTVSEQCPAFFVVKLGSNGSYRWVSTFAGLRASFTELAVLPNGDVVAVGYFAETMDFDPSGRDHSVTPQGVVDAFLLTLTPDGALRSVRTWGSAEGTTFAVDVAVLEDSLVVFGEFDGTVDFDPDVGEDLRTAVGDPEESPNGVSDAVAVALDFDGTHRWSRVWSGAGHQIAGGVASTADALYLSGHYDSEIQLEPAAVPRPVSSDVADGFVARVLADGSQEWADTWTAAPANPAASRKLWRSSIQAMPSEIVIAGISADRAVIDPDGHLIGDLFGNAFLTGLTPSGELRWALAADADPASGIDSIALTEGRIVATGSARGPVSVRDEAGSVAVELPAGVFVVAIDRPAQ